MLKVQSTYKRSAPQAVTPESARHRLAAMSRCLSDFQNSQGNLDAVLILRFAL